MTSPGNSNYDTLINPIAEMTPVKVPSQSVFPEDISGNLNWCHLSDRIYHCQNRCFQEIAYGTLTGVISVIGFM
jgi:hypothetical protein